MPKWLPKWASQLKTMLSDLRLRNGNFPFQNRKGCELGLYSTIPRKVHAKIEKQITDQFLRKCSKVQKGHNFDLLTFKKEPL